MHNLVFSFIHFHYNLDKATLDVIITDIKENGYFDEFLEAKVLEVLPEVYNEIINNF